jgi:hypothetical protein
MDWIPEPLIIFKFFLFFALGFENSRYIQAIRSGQTEIGEFGRRFVGFTSYAHACLMALVFALHWYDFGLAKTAVLFITIMFVVAPIISGAVLAKWEYYFREALWGYASMLIYPSATWLLFSFSWFGVK